MTAFLITLLRLSLLGSLLALVLFALKPLLRGRVSRTVSYYLWLLVLLRLCVPAGLTLTLPAREAPAEPVQPPAPAVTQTVQTAPEPSPVVSDLPAAVPAPVETQAPAEPVRWTAVLTGIWAAGALFCAGIYLGSYIRLWGKIRRSAKDPTPEALALLGQSDLSRRVRLAESAAVNTPLLLGAIRPVIVLPPHLTDPARLRDILAHELTHARRHDLLYKWFAVFTSCIHWFNPLVFFIRREISRACELACDEAVIKTLDIPARQHYGETLLSLAACTPPASALPMCGEKRNLKERLVSIVKLHQRTPLAILLSAALVLTIGGCALVQDAAHPPVAGILNTETGDTITFGMTIEEVGEITHDDRSLTWDMLHYDLNAEGKESYLDLYRNDTLGGTIAVGYIENRVMTLSPPMEKGSKWGTMSGLTYGSTLKEVKANLKGYDLDVDEVSAEDHWFCKATASDHYLRLSGSEAEGLEHIEVRPPEKYTGITTSTDTYTRDTPGFVGVENRVFNGEEKPCVTLGMTPEEIGERIGRGLYVHIDPEPSLPYYDYYGSILVGYQEGKAVQMLTANGYFYRNSTDYTEPLPVTSTRGITTGSTLEEVLNAYPEARIGEEVAPLWFGLDTAKKCIAVNVQEDGYTLTFWMKGTGVYDTVFAMGLTAADVPFPDMKGALPS